VLQRDAFFPEELPKDLDCPSLQKLAGLVHKLQLEFGPAEGFQTALRMLQCYTKLVSIAALLAELSQLDATQIACCLLLLLLLAYKSPLLRTLQRSANRKMLPSKHTPGSSRQRSDEQDPDVSDDKDIVISEGPLLSRDAAQALAKATGLLTKVWEQKVLDKDVVSIVYLEFQKDHKPVCNSVSGAPRLMNGAEFLYMLTKIFVMQISDEIKDHVQKNVANFEMVPEKMFYIRLMKKFNNHKQTIGSGKKGTTSPYTILELMLARITVPFSCSVQQRFGFAGKRAASVSAHAAASEIANPNQAADQSTSVSANAAEAPTSRN